MRGLFAPLAIVLALIVAVPLAANAQNQDKRHQPAAKTAPAKAAAAPARSAAPRAAPRPAVRARAPHPAAHIAPRVIPHRAAAPRAAPHPVARRTATPHRQAPTVNRAAQQRQIKRAQRHPQAQPASKAVQRRQQVKQQQQRVQQRQQQKQTRPASKAAQQRQQQKQAQPNTAVTQPPTQKGATTTLQLQRDERAQRRREDRELRKLPASQRAQRREVIRHSREQRALERQQVQRPNAAARANAAAQTTGAVRPNARAQRHALRRNRTAAVTPQAARRGRFAAPFAAHAQAPAFRRARSGHYAPRRAWSRGYRAAFVPWYGPVFWPYAYSDIFDYVFWPRGYVDGYWAYVYDDFIDSLFWGEQGPPDEYLVYGAPPPPRPSYRAVQALCKQPGSGITAWPFAEIERKVGLDGEQKRLLDSVRDAAKQAAGVFKASCPAEKAFPLTPPGRLRAMMARLDATLQAVETVRPALEAFYDSLSDEQKERFNEIGPKGQKSTEASQALPQSAQACAEAKPGLTNLPIERVEAAVKPNDAQLDALDRLDDATVKAVSILQAACPEDTPLTPPGRLEAMEARLKAMLDAANTVKPALDDFYGSLSSEQKARFNRIGRELAESKS